MATKELIGVGDLARRLNVPPWRIGRLFDEHRLPEPARVAGRRVLGLREIRRVCELLGVPIPLESEPAAPSEAAK